MTLQEKIAKLNRKGMTNKAIAEQLGCSPDYVRAALSRVRHGGLFPCERDRLDSARKEAEKRKAAKLDRVLMIARQGGTISEVAEAFCCTYSGAHKFCLRNGIRFSDRRYREARA